MLRRQQQQRYGSILVILLIALYQVSSTETSQTQPQLKYKIQQHDLLRQQPISSNTFVQWVLSLLQRPQILTNVTATAATLTETTTIQDQLLNATTIHISTTTQPEPALSSSTTEFATATATSTSTTTAAATATATASTTAMPSSSSSSSTSTTTRPIIVTSTTTKTPIEPAILNPARNCKECYCGIANVQKRIVGGQETEIHQYPWVAMLIYSTRFYCAASLINDQYLITASHCVYGFRKERITVRLLEHDRKMSHFAKIDRKIAEIITHPKYNARTYDNDIAIIRLDEPVEMNEVLHPVCMPTPGKSFRNYTGIVTGWGALKVGGATSDTLQEVQVPIMSQDQCRKTRYGASRITDNMLCAGFDEGKKDSCQGDSGGPLHILATGTREHQLVGVVSWGEGCAKAGYPGVYSRVNRYGTWIKMMTRNACLCQSETKKIKKY